MDSYSTTGADWSAGVEVHSIHRPITVSLTCLVHHSLSQTYPDSSLTPCDPTLTLIRVTAVDVIDRVQRRNREAPERSQIWRDNPDCKAGFEYQLSDPAVLNWIPALYFVQIGLPDV
jgi:hypothetical protein